MRVVRGSCGFFPGGLRRVPGGGCGGGGGTQVGRRNRHGCWHPGEGGYCHRVVQHLLLGELRRWLCAAGSPVVVVALGVGWGWSGSGVGAADAGSLPGTCAGAGCRGLWGKGVWMRTCWLGFAGGVTLSLLLCSHI